MHIYVCLYTHRCVWFSTVLLIIFMPILISAIGLLFSFFCLCIDLVSKFYYPHSHMRTLFPPSCIPGDLLAVSPADRSGCHGGLPMNPTAIFMVRF